MRSGRRSILLISMASVAFISTLTARADSSLPFSGPQGAAALAALWTSGANLARPPGYPAIGK